MNFTILLQRSLLVILSLLLTQKVLGQLVLTDFYLDVPYLGTHNTLAVHDQNKDLSITVLNPTGNVVEGTIKMFNVRTVEGLTIVRTYFESFQPGESKTFTVPSRLISAGAQTMALSVHFEPNTFDLYLPISAPLMPTQGAISNPLNIPTEWESISNINVPDTVRSNETRTITYHYNIEENINAWLTNSTTGAFVNQVVTSTATNGNIIWTVPVSIPSGNYELHIKSSTKITEGISTPFFLEQIKDTTIVPIADFNLSDTSICNGNFTIVSYQGTGGYPTRLSWNFGGGTLIPPLAASDIGPHYVKYTSSGQVQISVLASNIGGSDNALHTVAVDLCNLISLNDFDFGYVQLGDTAQQAITVTNLHNLDSIIVGNVIYDLSSNAFFTDNLGGLELPPSGDTVINVYFAPDSLTIADTTYVDSLVLEAFLISSYRNGVNHRACIGEFSGGGFGFVDGVVIPTIGVRKNGTALGTNFRFCAGTNSPNDIVEKVTFMPPSHGPVDVPTVPISGGCGGPYVMPHTQQLDKTLIGAGSYNFNFQTINGAQSSIKNLFVIGIEYTTDPTPTGVAKEFRFEAVIPEGNNSLFSPGDLIVKLVLKQVGTTQPYSFTVTPTTSTNSNDLICSIDYQFQGNGEYEAKFILIYAGDTTESEVRIIDTNKDKILWDVDHLTQVYYRNWSTACMPTSTAMIINYMFSREFEEVNGIWREKANSLLSSPFRTNGQRLYDKGITIYWDYSGDLTTYMNSYPKNGLEQRFAIGCSSGFGPCENEVYGYGTENYNQSSNCRADWNSGIPSPTNNSNAQGSKVRMRQLLGWYGIFRKDLTLLNKESTYVDNIKKGPIIISRNKHIFVIVGRNENGEFIINDPFFDEIKNNWGKVSDNSYQITCTWDQLNYIINWGILHATLIPIKENTLNPIFSPYNLYGSSDLNFINPVSNNCPTGVSYDGDGMDNWNENSFSYSGESNQDYSQWYYEYKKGQGSLLCKSIVGTASTADATWEIIANKSGLYDIYAGYVKDPNNSSDVQYSISINNAPSLGTFSVDQTNCDCSVIGKCWRLIKTGVYLTTGQKLKISVNNLTTGNSGKNIRVDMVKGIYRGLNSSFLACQDLSSEDMVIAGSIMPRVKIFHESNYKTFLGESNARGILSTKLPTFSIVGQKLSFIANGYHDQTVTIDSNKVKDSRHIIPMFKDATYPSVSSNLQVNINNNLFVSQTPSIDINISGNNISYFEVLYNDIFIPLTSPNNTLTVVLDTGYNYLEFRAISSQGIDTFGRSIYYFPQDISYAGYHSANDSFPLRMAYDLILELDSTCQGALLMIGNEYVTELHGLRDTIKVPEHYTQLRVFKQGYLSKEINVISFDSTVSLSLQERSRYHVENNVDFSQNQVQFAGVGISVKNDISNDSLKAIRSDSNWINLGIKHATDKFSFEKDFLSQSLTTAAIMFDEPVFTPTGKYVLRDNNGLFSKQLLSDFEFDTLHQKIIIDSIAEGINQFIIAEQQAPSPIDLSFNVYLSDTLFIALTSICSNPDSIPDLLSQVSNFNTQHINASIINDSLRIISVGNRVITDTVEMVFTHDFISEQSLIIINLLSPFTHTTNTTHPICQSNNGQIEINNTILSVNQGMTYLWTNGESTMIVDSLSAGTYEVTLTHTSGYTIINQIILTTDTLTINNFSVINDSCYAATGGLLPNITGTAPYLYTWSNGTSNQQLQGIQSGWYQITITDGAGCIVQDSAFVDSIFTLQTSQMLVNATCGLSNGSTDITVDVGIAPYSFSWSSGETIAALQSVSAGVYFCSITDAKGCTVVEEVNINTSTPISINYTKQDVTCNNDGSISLNVNGGTGVHSILWSNTVTDPVVNNLVSGIYTVHVIDTNGCFIRDTIEILDNTLSSSITTNIDSCSVNGGNAFVSIYQGTAPYSYIWTTGSTGDSLLNVSSGIYQVTISDAGGCEEYQQVIIQIPSPLSNQLISHYDSCFVKAITNGGSPPYSYLWNNGITSSIVPNVNQGDAYTVIVTDNVGCLNTESITAVGGNISILNYTQNLSTIQFIGIGTWILPDTIITGIDPIYTFNQIGTFPVSFDNGCGPITTNIVITVIGTINIDVVNSNEFIKVYPNPTTGLLIVDFSNLKSQIPESATVYNYQGKEIKQFSISNKQLYRLDLSDLPVGIYLLKVKLEGINTPKSIKFTISK